MAEKQVRVGYELEGLLAEALPTLETAWRDMDQTARKAYRQQQLTEAVKAKVLRRPTGDFYVITVRRAMPGLEQATRAWLNKHFPGKVGALAMLDKARTHDNILAFKLYWIEKMQLTEYYETDVKLVRELQHRCPGVKIHWATYNLGGEHEMG